MEKKGLKFNIMAAMQESDRGIGYKGRLPWPAISEDYNYYKLTTMHIEDTEKKNIHIKGRATWNDMAESLKVNNTNAIFIVLSSSLRQEPEHCQHIATSLHDALNIARSYQHEDKVETIWILGGEAVYKEAVASPHCDKVYLTRIQSSFPSDRFFPEFEKDFDIISESPAIEEGGIPFKFYIYQKKF